MKKVLLFFMLLLATSAFAQDVIVKKDGSTILSKVIEIGTSEVKYKKYSNPDGPTYTIAKSEIQAINYENGEKETFTDAVVTPSPQPQQDFNYNNYTTTQVVEGIAAGNKLQKEKLLASAKNWHVTGNVWFWVCLGVGCISGGIITYNKGDGAWIPAVIGGCSGLIGFGICEVVSHNKEKAANTIASVPVIKQDFNLGNSRLSAGVNLMNDKIRNDYALGLGFSMNF